MTARMDLGMKVGFANGCFDLFHDGHRHFLTGCRRHCDYLIVAVNCDSYCARVKGEGRPHEPLRIRMLHVRMFAEAVIPFGGREDPLLLEIRPDVLFVGYDHGAGLKYIAARTPGWKEPTQAPYPAIWHGEVVHIGHLPGFSTTLAAAKLTSTPEGGPCEQAADAAPPGPG